MNVRIQGRAVLFLCSFLVGLFILTGCMSERELGRHSVLLHNKEIIKEAIPPSFTGQDLILPIQIEEGQFNSVSGWLNNDKIIYTTNVGLGSNIYTYNIFNGENQLIFESDAPVSSITVSPSGNQLLIHSVPTTYGGIITIIDDNGNEIMSERIEAFDFVIEWNPYDENILLLSLFSEDWDFSTQRLNLADKSMVSIELEEPFIQWKSADEVIYLDWDQQQPSLLAPLMKKPLTKGGEQVVFDEIYYMKAIKNYIMTITIPSDKINESVYTFLSNDFNEVASFTFPHLTRYSDWLIPYFDFTENHQIFTLAPLYYSEFDTYGEGFQLLSLNIDKGEETVILDDLGNEPISCSPNGANCLYGFYLEKLININTKEMTEIVKE
ncbi:hypothetical protein J2Z40_001434 [Cytobacillus eiseniae]|uniref:YqgU-like 6-bladed beta-propeller domain-containing protein n=1 Tax=Cytobacillus eiseniae TaxID=762947 RepID=A0ABS4RDA4_9BACI|nr:hypothetical protein [Cytobacillus eiseniae]MBP2240875.1 hypothetical protein [Cytobacillus eiseniae]